MAEDGRIGPTMSPAAKRSLNEDPNSELAPLDELPLTDGPIKSEDTDAFRPARYKITASDRLGHPIEMIREDR